MPNSSDKLARMRTIHLLLLLPGLVMAMPAMAQWQWQDQNNKMVFSDRPPPGDVPEAKILKRPASVAPRAGAAAPSASAATPAPARAGEAQPALPPVAGKDKELEERRQQADKQEAAKKAAAEQAQASARADNCARAKQAKATYDSGVRIARTAANGEREILDDAARAAETRRLQGIIASDCQ